MAWVAKVNRHVSVLIKKTYQGNTEYVKRRPAVITALGVGNLITCRVGHHDADLVTPGFQPEVYTNIDRRTNPDEDWTVVKYVSY